MKQTLLCASAALTFGVMANASVTCAKAVQPSAVQTAADPQAATPAPGKALPQSGQVEEIVVTAQRREQNLQSTPVAVAAFNAAALASRGIASTTDLQQVVPNLVMYPQATSISPFLRGIGTKNSVAGDENATAIYVDGVYISSAAASIFALNNVAQIEVLNGPQGTLFGRNATAGVIQIITRTPDQTRPRLEADLGYGNYNAVDASLYASTPVTDHIATDFAFLYHDQQDGFGRDIADGSQIFKGEDIALRNKWRAEINSRATLTVEADASYTVPNIPPLYRAVNGSVLVGGYTAQGGYFDTNTNTSSPGFDAQWGVAAHLDYDLGWATAKSITSYRHVDSAIYFDADGTPVNIQYAKIDQRSKTYSQELQLLSPRSSRISWAAGLFYWHDDTGTLPFYLNFKGAMSDSFATQTTNSYAAYGQFTAPLAFQTNFTGGVRYTADFRNVDGYKVPFTVSGPGPATLVNNPEPKKEFDKITWRFALDHHFTDRILGYISDNRGFKSGVYNLFSPSSVAVRPETLDTYEGGLKTETFDRRLRLNGDVFYNDFRDIQLQVPVAGQGTQLYNAASGRSYGVELNADTATFHGFSLNGGLAYLGSDYTKFPSAPLFFPKPGGGLTAVTGSAQGNQFIIAPHWSGDLSLHYSLDAASGRYSANISDAYNGGFWFDVQNRDRQTAYQLVNLTLEWRSPSTHYGVMFWAKNLTDARYLVNEVPSAFGDVGTPGEPITFGGKVMYRF